MILFYTPGTCALAELALLQWTGEPHRLCRVSRDERQGEIYRRCVNGMGQVPALLVDGRVLTENLSLLLLLADRRPERGLVPLPHTNERYDVYRWLAWLDSAFHVAHKPMFNPQRYVPDEALFDRVRAHAMTPIRAMLTILDRQLRSGPFMLGARRSLLDPYTFAMARWCETRIDYGVEFPAVRRFLDTMRADSGVRRALAIEQGDGTTIADPVDNPCQGHVPFDELVPGGVALRLELDR